MSAQSAGATRVESENICACALGSLQSRYGESEFLELEQKMLRGEETGFDMEQIVLACV